MRLPNPGEMVWYHGLTTGNPFTQPCAAFVAYIHSSNMVNLTVLSPSGATHGVQNVTLRQPEDEVPTGHYCEWPPTEQSFRNASIEASEGGAESQSD
jgi:hypothetical protein